MKTYQEFLNNKGEEKWQKQWEKKKLFQTPEDVTPDNKYYILDMFPYPSGSGLHVGHVEGYTATDILARWQKMKGKKVLHPMGWDAFGLPAENYAIKTGVHPDKNTKKAVQTFKGQMDSIGFTYDWDREINTSDPNYYKWTQWFFLLFYKRGLAYRKKQAVNWCDSCKTVLANDQVKEGHCERCDTLVAQKDMEQWYIKVTEYADKLLEGLDKIDWPEETKKRQKDWIGRSEGASVRFAVIASPSTSLRTGSAKQSQTKQEIASSSAKTPRNDGFIEVFTTRPDTLFGATYMVLAPEGQYVQDLKDSITNWDEVEKYIEKTSKKTELDRQIDKEKTGVELKGIKAINPVNKEQIPIFVADYVLASYGTGAIMAVPAHDERDFEFAKKFGIDVREVISGGNIKEEAFTDDGKLLNSDFLNDLSVDEAKTKMIEWLEENNIGKGKVQYKLRDWSVSRQRFWGAPIPVLENEAGELKPVPESDLPVLLPEDVDFKPTGESPLNYSEEFKNRAKEKYGDEWRYEPDTLDTFMCSSWYYFRYLDPKNDGAFASPEALKKWMPVDFYLGGPEHVNGHLLYSRFFTKVLYDAGYIDFDEPFKTLRHQGLILGPDNRKMSKRWGNVINPTDVVNEYGADTCRMYEMFMGPLEDDKPWGENGVKGVRRFLDKVWKLQFRVRSSEFTGDNTIDKLTHKAIKKVGEDLESLGFNTAISEMMKLVNEMTKSEEISITNYQLLITILSPFAPHMTEELWSKLENEGSICEQPWPEYDPELVKDDEITLVVQVNGKVRGEMNVSVDISVDDAKKQALEIANVVKWLDGKEPKKVIYVKGKLVSIVI